MVLAVIVIAGLLALLASLRRAAPRPRPSAAPEESAPEGHPESLTAELEPGAEEYLAWLADHHWPADDYLDLEQQWRHELGLLDLTEVPHCPSCLLRREDVWPCPRCGALLHSSCGHGMRRRPVAQPYHALGLGDEPEAVIAEWICTGCASVVGLDVENDSDPLS
ncbi:hypothetical protein [Actinomadura rupiterrae]|uniref:hypothetical protein n=1 Tax=Actinomadura rupiterrae TaxID=559627 RepID=UPI0020A3837E|nr:hypothetical protein [Actinomadura rupiterrae]MCP2339528.1 hypothetical protein [Actinomadura rupiterrae]